ncbi:4-hydroxybenzoate polyprenyltransferase [Bacterioplanes sanyensis]|uniref:4-hydroxybenzoate octaprenyltransferase n=1 Tax=Bacterioplanes sanyensis TaxID=1249553 RepID=A0A222FGZ8_9GAMM|nr:4-hydroxybenzoate octaprenyltransferase [Bacterioplanes sanyensis]ASP38029.1 4-hydroxybenzoate polyprenyltransferase [Bacterioplanes sanyensis]
MRTLVTQQLDKLWPAWIHWVQLTRLDRPIGSYLLLWPTLAALIIAAHGMPALGNVVIFVVGVFLMRSAGCVINDFADRKIDGHVKRTKDRPLATGKLTSKQALTGFAMLISCAFVLVLMTNPFTIALSFAGLALASIYPFMKRHTHMPQLFLGAAYSWSIPMAFAAQSNELPQVVWLLYCANLTWTVAFDTMYAMVDRDDDLRIGVKSTAVLLGDLDVAAVASLMAITGLFYLLAGQQLQLGLYFYLGWALAQAFAAWQIWHIRQRQREDCFRMFRLSHWYGALIFAGIAAHYAWL